MDTANEFRRQIEECHDSGTLLQIKQNINACGFGKAMVLDWDEKHRLPLGSMIQRREYVLRGGGAHQCTDVLTQDRTGGILQHGV